MGSSLKGSDRFQGGVAGSLNGPLIILFAQQRADQSDNEPLIWEDADDLAASLDCAAPPESSGQTAPRSRHSHRQRRNSRIIRTDLHNDTGVPGRRRRDLVGRMRLLPSPATRQSGAHPLGHRLCLSGTPIENNLQELWSEFALLMPGLLGDRKFFAKQFRTPIEKNDNAVRRVQLVRRIKPFLLRRTKSEVASDLPAKHTILRRINLAPEQRELYKTIRGVARQSG